MDRSLERFLEDLIAFGRTHDAQLEDPRKRLRNVAPDTARMLALLLRATRARRVLEIGTSNGYSTLWLADAAADTRGRVTTIELDAGRAEMARQNFLQIGFVDRIELRLEDAAQALRASPDERWDSVFPRRGTLRVRWLLERPCPHATAARLLAVDNVVSHADEVAEFRELVESTDGVTSALVPIGAGVLLITRTRDGG